MPEKPLTAESNTQWDHCESWHCLGLLAFSVVCGASPRAPSQRIFPRLFPVGNPETARFFQNYMLQPRPDPGPGFKASALATAALGRKHWSQQNTRHFHSGKESPKAAGTVSPAVEQGVKSP